MHKYLYIIMGILIPLLGTSIGSSLVLFLKNKVNNKIEKFLIGFAIGIMISASIFSLLIPSIEMSESLDKLKFIPSSVGFILGFIFLIIINKISEKIKHKKGKKIDMLFFSVTVHNIPEGMAVGVAFASVLSTSGLLMIEAFVLSIGIALQNIPEGAIISLPLKLKGKNKFKSFLYGFLSGVVEPISSVITIILINYVVLLLPYFLSFASGAMIYVVIEELVLEMNEKGKSIFGIIGVMIGFVVMMALDVVLS